jgi:lipoprotein-releasing system permease protein
VPWYLYLALKQLFPTGRKFPFFTAISVLGVALGVALLVISTSVMGGFGHEIKRMIVDTQGEVQVRSDGYINDAAGVLARLSTVPGVVGTTPFAEGIVQLEYDRKAAYPVMQGIDINRVGKVVPLERFIRAGSLNDLDDDSIILSSKLALSIGARLGSKVEVTSPLLLVKLKNDEVFLPRELRVVGIFQIGHGQLDSTVVLVTLRLMQELYGLGTAIHGVNVKIAPDLDADVAAARINAVLRRRGPTTPPGAPDAQAADRDCKKLFGYSILYLFLLFGVIVIENSIVTVLRVMGS